MTVEGLEEIAVHVADAAKPKEENKLRHIMDCIIDFSAGTIGGFANCLVAQPFDTVKVKLQTFPGDYQSSYECCVRTYQGDGVMRGLYAGVVPAMVAHVAENAVLFTFYGLCQKTVMKIFNLRSEQEMTVLYSGLAGSGASVFSSLVLCPTELVKCRLQASRNMLEAGQLVSEHAHQTTSSLCRHIVRHEGWLGFYRGLSGTIVREIPGYFCFFGGYELSRTLLTPPGMSKNDLSPWKTIFSGGMGGIALWTVIYPIDSIKSRQQVYTHLSEPMKFFPTLKKLLGEGGVAVLYRGLGATIVRTFFSTGALFFTYENTKTLFKSQLDGAL